MTDFDGVKAAALLFVAAIVQVSIFSDLHLFGAVPDVLLVSLVSLSLLRGSVVGAVGGFFAGLLVDTATLGMLGLSSLVLTLAGYWIGRYGETTGRDRAHAPFLSVAVVTVLYELGLLVVQFVLGASAPAGAVVRSLVPTIVRPDHHRADLRARTATAAPGSARRADGGGAAAWLAPPLGRRFRARPPPRAPTRPRASRLRSSRTG
jgi:rod shape-determining protein MreD